MGSMRLVWKFALVLVALMSGILSLGREVLQFVDPSKYPDRPLFYLCLKIAFALSLLILLGEEYRLRREAEKRWEDARPCLGLEVLSYDGKNTWLTHNNPVTFQVKLLSGRVPTAVRFDAVPSRGGKFFLVFDALPHVDNPVPKILNFEVKEAGKEDSVSRINEMNFAEQRDALLGFLRDTSGRSGEVDYPLTVRFQDRNESREQTFRLRWDWVRYGFRRDTT